MVKKALASLLCASLSLGPTASAFAQYRPAAGVRTLPFLQTAAFRASGPVLGPQALTAQLAATLLVQPSLIAANRPILVQALGEPAVLQLETGAKELQAAASSDAALFAQVQALQAAFKPDADVPSLLAGFFDGSQNGSDVAGLITGAEGALSRPLPPRTAYSVTTVKTLTGKSSFQLAAKARSTFGSLAQDPYFRGRGKRYRASAEIVALPDPLGGTALRLEVKPGASFTGESGSASYPGMDADLVNSPEFRSLVLALIDGLPENVKRHGVRVGVHQIRVADGEVTPEGRHQDDFTSHIAVWSVARGNAQGGETRLFTQAKGGKAALAKTLAPGEVLLLDNHALWHEVLPIARKDAQAGPAVRDVIVFSFSAAPAPVAELTGPALAGALETVSAEFSTSRPDAGVLRALYDSGSAKLRAALYRAFKAWSRYFSPDSAGAGTRWQFLKTASAPWAGHLYVKKAQSFFEWVAEQKGEQRDAEADAKAVHDADGDFSRALIAAAEAAAPGLGLDAEEAALAVSDEDLYALVLRPLIDGKQTSAWDRAALLEALAERLKGTVFLYNAEITVENVRALLAQDAVRAKFDRFLDLVEEHLPPPAKDEAGGAKDSSLLKTIKKNGSALGLFLLAVLGAALGVPPMPLAMGTVEPQRSGAPLPGYLSDLTESARQNELPPIYLRDKEVSTLIGIFNKTANNNAFLIGEPGVGKTAIAEGLAIEIAARRTGTELDEQRVMLLDVGKFLGVAAKSPDVFASEVDKLIALVSDGKTILFIDEAHQLSRDNGSVSFGSFYDQIKVAMTKGRLKLGLATTKDEYKQFFAKDRALESRSQVLYIDPVEPGPAVELLYRIRERFEKGARISYEAAKAAVDLTVRAYRFDALLRMAINAMDSAATRVRIRGGQAQNRVLALRRDLGYHLGGLREARAGGNLARQEALLGQLAGLLDEFASAREDSAQAPSMEVTRQDVAAALKDLGAPSSLDAGTAEHLASVEALLRKNLIARDELIGHTIDALKRRFAKPGQKKPVFSTLLLGPTGTGKTEFARLLGKAFYRVEDVEKSVIKINGGEYQSKADLWGLIGSRPGFVGYGETETLMDKVRRKPESVILVDEVEKMHPDILNLFLSILEDGSAKDGSGRPTDFSNTMVVFTSNYGVPAGDYGSLADDEFKAQVKAALDSQYAPFRKEFLNRLDHLEVFPPFSREEARAITDLRLDQLAALWKSEHGVAVSFTDRQTMVDAVVSEGYSRTNNARELNRLLARRLEKPLSDRLVDGTLKAGDQAVFQLDGSLSIGTAARVEKSLALTAKTPAGKALAEKLESVLADFGGEGVLSFELLDAVLGLRETPVEPQPRLHPGFVADGVSEPLKVHKPKAADKAFDDAAAAVEKLAGAEARKQAKALVVLGKRLNLEASEPEFTALSQKAAGMTAKESAALRLRLAAAVTSAERERTVSLSWRVRAGRILLRVEAAAVDLAAEQRLKSLLPEGAVYELQDGKTVLWSELSTAPAGLEPPQKVVAADVVPEFVVEPVVDDSLVAKLAVMMDEKSSGDLVHQTILELEEAVYLRPGEVSPAFARALEQALDLYRVYRVKNGGDVQAKDLATVGRKHAPTRPIRTLFTLYTGLLSSRPDLIPQDSVERARSLLSIPFYRSDETSASHEVTAWEHSRGRELLGLTLAARPDLASPAGLLSMTLQLRGLADKRSWPGLTVQFSIGGVLAGIICVIGIAASLKDHGLPWQDWEKQFQWAYYSLPLGPLVTWAASRLGMANRTWYHQESVKLEERFYLAAKDLPPAHILPLISDFHTESGRWLPKYEWKALFKRLALLPPYAKAIAPRL